MNWQKEHERLLDTLNEVAGRRVKNFAVDTAHLRGSKLALAKALNAENSIAVSLYYSR